MTKNDIFTLKKGIDTLNNILKENNVIQLKIDELYMDNKKQLRAIEIVLKEIKENKGQFIRKDDKGNEIHLTSKDLGLEEIATKIDTTELEKEKFKFDNNHKKLIDNDDVKTIKFKRG